MIYHWLDKSFDPKNLSKYRLDIYVDDSEIRLCASKVKSNRIAAFSIIEHGFGDFFDEKSFLEITKNQPLPFSKKYSEVTWCYANFNFTIMPAHLVEKDQAEKILASNASIDGDIRIDQVSENEISIISDLPSSQVKFLSKHFPGIKKVHFSAIIYKLCRVAADQRKAVLIYIQNSQLYIGLFNSGNLEFLNIFHNQSPADLLYYLGVVVQMNNINRETDPLLIMGDIEKNGEAVELLKKYFKEIIFPLPYLVTQDASLEHSQPNHYFSGLFNQRVCV